ncbi:hypothetical protein [Labrys monachus]|uniref:Uncharacterized protein n=1 Tax=Labrys monachus TaxID=217067 RepID=A0ABU0FC46_9HYPH|nr:hypothetical protein [Labrys monachus]MDQ0392187.1 hypothetical protein [Labrys monachus]
MMDAAGVPVSQQRYLSTALVNNLASSIHNSDRTLAERMAPLEAVFAAVKKPDLQRAIFSQCVKAGLPPLLQPMAVALAQGDRGVAGRLAEAVLVDPPGSAGGSSDQPPHPDLLAGPVQIGDGLDRARRTGLLFTRLIQHGLARNGGDLDAAVVQTRSDLFGNRPILPGDIVLP